MPNLVLLQVYCKIYAVLLSNKSKFSDSWIIRFSLLDKLSYRYPQAAQHDRLIGFRIFYPILRKILSTKVSYKKILNGDGIAIYDVYDRYHNLQTDYVNKQNPEKVSWYIYKVALWGHFYWYSIFFQVLLFSFFSFPFIVMSLFSKKRVNYALLITEAVEVSSLLYILRKNKIKKVFDFIPYEKDGNLVSHLLMQNGIYVVKVPSPGPLYLHNSLMLGNHLILSSQYQFEEYERMKRNGIKIRSVEKWLPEFAFEYVDLYTSADKQRKNTVNKIGYYSHGSWIREKEGHSRSILRIYEDEVQILSFINSFVKRRPELSLTVFMHPRERKPEVFEIAKAFYNENLPDIEFGYSDIDKKTSHGFDDSDLALCAYSSVIYERLFCGFKTLIGLPHTDAFPMKESVLNNIVFKTYDDMAKKVDYALQNSAEEFFKTFGLNGYLYSDYPYFKNKRPLREIS